MVNFYEEELEYACCPFCGLNKYEILYLALDIKISFQCFPVVKCHQCGLVYTNPRPTENSMGKYYGKEYYSYQIFQSDEKPSETTVPKKKILDIGCGSGSWLYKQKLMGNEVFGVEISAEAVEVGRQKGLFIFHGKLEDANFSDNYFDLIRMNHVLEHTYSPLDILKEVMRVLNKTGNLIFEVPNIDSIESFLLHGSWRQLEVPRHLCHFSPRTLEKFIRKAELRITEKRMKPFPDTYKDINAYLRCQYTTAKLIFHELKNKKKSLSNSFLIFACIFKLISYLSKYWTLRLLRWIKPENKSLIQYVCMPNK